MSWLDVNKQFFKEVFESYKQKMQWELNATKSEIPETALSSKELVKPYPLSYYKLIEWQKVAKQILVNDNPTRISSTIRSLLALKEIIQEPTSKVVPEDHWTMWEDWVWDKNFDLSIWKQQRDDVGNLLQWESVSIIISKSGDPISLSLSYTNFTWDEPISYSIFVNPNWKIELLYMKDGKRKMHKAKNLQELNKKLDKYFPKNKPANLSTILPVA